MYKNDSSKNIIETKKVLSLTGAGAACEAMRQIEPGVVAAYPITPQTPVVMEFSEVVEKGLVDTTFIPVESEHSAMSAVLGAQAAGVRAMTATSSQGLAYMVEIMYIASSYRLPSVMIVANRALSGPLNIHCDHSDAMLARDSGWIQLFCVDSQEVYDSIIIGLKIAENKNVLLPCMVNMDGFIVSHSLERVEILPDEVVKNFIGKYSPLYSLLEVDRKLTFGAMDSPEYYMEHKRQQHQAMKNAYDVIPVVFSEFQNISGRKYHTIETFKMEDAEYGIIVMGSTYGTAIEVVQGLRTEGLKVGVCGIRVFRPFPEIELSNVCKNLKAVAILDRADALNGIGGPLYNEVRASFYTTGKTPKIVNYIYGLGGRDCTTEMLKSVYKDLIEENFYLNVKYLGVREK